MTVALRTARTRGLFVVAIVLTMLASAAPANAAANEKFWIAGCNWEMRNTSWLVIETQVRDVNGWCHSLNAGLRFTDRYNRTYTRYSGFSTRDVVYANSGNHWARHDRSRSLATWHQWDGDSGWKW